MGYNVFYTGMIALFFVLDRDVDPDVLKDWPAGYKPIRQNIYLNYSTFFLWFIRAVYQSVVVFGIVTSCMGSRYIAFNGRALNDEELGLVAFTALVWIQIVTIFIESSTITKWNVLVLIGTQLAVYIFNILFSTVPQLSMYALMFHLLVESVYWLTVFLVLAIALIPVLAMKYIMFNYFPTDMQIRQYRHLMSSKNYAPGKEMETEMEMELTLIS
jgi:magnesium-transporting ATPase (P-type)